jgi:hypothetical protein
MKTITPTETKNILPADWQTTTEKKHRSLLSSFKSALCGFFFICGASAFAQTATNTPAANPLIAALQNTIVDTNSSFFNTGKLEIRALTQTTITSYESVLAATYYTGTNDNFGIGAEMINGALNTVDAGYLTIEYAVPYHNLKFRPILGVGYDFVNRGLALEMGGALEVAIGPNMFADTESLYKIPLHDFSGQGSSGELRLGIGWKF